MAAEALIVGGGLAGAAAATALARSGREVVLLEREAEAHDKVCGEFLSREAILYLNALGVDPAALGAHRIDRVRLALGRRVVTAKLPFTALSLSRRTLDAAVLARAAGSGVDVKTGAAVQALERQGEGWRARLRGGAVVDAEAAFLATGKHDLRGWTRPKGLQSGLIGFKLYWRLPPAEAAALTGHVELMLFRGGYAGLELVEGGRANLCLLVRRDRFAALGQRWETLFAAIRADCPLLDRRLTGAEACLERPLAIYAIPYGHIATGGDGLWRLGDQAAVIPSFSGDGMSVALHSAALAARCFLAGASATEFQRRMARDIRVPVRFATLVSLLAVNSVGRAIVGTVALTLPRLIAAAASGTRVPLAALQRAGMEAEEQAF